MISLHDLSYFPVILPVKSFRNTISYIFVDVGDNHSDTKLQMTSRAFLRQNLEVTPVMIEYELLSVVPFI